LTSHTEDQCECFHCRQIFKSPIFETACEWNRVVYSDGLPSVEIEEHQWLEQYCSEGCRNARLDVVMAREDVPIRRPGLGPIELCAKCRRPVDMSRLHLTYLETRYFIDEHDGLTPVDADYLAVLCQQCAPDGSAGDVEVASENQAKY
jgi:hypothetical protein